jgi:hypothetical protein
MEKLSNKYIPRHTTGATTGYPNETTFTLRPVAYRRSIGLPQFSQSWGDHFAHFFLDEPVDTASRRFSLYV